jgi:hypothetical protein
MAKKTPNVIDDDFDLDKFDDFDFDIPDPTVPDNRAPTTKVKAGFKEGAVNRVKSPGFLKEALKHAFPRSFGDAVDLSDAVTESARNLYDESVKEIKPTLLMAKKTVSKLVPNDAKILPKFVQDRLKLWKEETKDQENQEPSKDAVREAFLGQSLKDVFEAQEQMATMRQADQIGRENLRTGMQRVQFKSQLDAANRAAISLKRLDDYNTNIGLSYQKKSLELQYRQLFAAQDILEFSKQDVIRRNEFLAAIAKNTGLPEFVKLTNKEAGQEMRRRKVFDMYHNALFGVGDQFITQGIEKMKRMVVEGTRNFMQDFRGGLQDAQMAGDMASDGMMGDKHVMAGNVAGEFATQGAGNFIAKKLFGKIQGSKADQKFGITDKFHKLDDVLENLPRTLKEFKESRKDEFSGTLSGELRQFIRDMMPSMGGDKGMSPTTSKNLFTAATFTTHTQRSITEIIPGYLARIFRELQVLRTGKRDIKLTDFSHDRGTFTDRGELEGGVVSKVIPNRAARRVRDELSDFVGEIDNQNELSEEERAALKKRLLTNSADKNLASEDRLASTKEGAYKGEDAEVQKRVSAVMKRHMEQLSAIKRAEFSRKHNRLAEYMEDPRQVMQDLLETGNIDQLRELGLITEHGEGPIKDVKVNVAEIVRRYLEGSDSSGGGGGSSPFGPGPQTPAGSFGNVARAAKPHVDRMKTAASDQINNIKQAVSDKTPQAFKDAAASVQSQTAQGFKRAKAFTAGAYTGLKNQSGPYSEKMAGYGQQMKTSFTGLKMPEMKPEHKEALDRAKSVVMQRAKDFSSQAADLVHPEQIKQAAQALSQGAQEKLAPTMNSVTDSVTRLQGMVKNQAEGLKKLTIGAQGELHVHMDEAARRFRAQMGEAVESFDKARDAMDERVRIAPEEAQRMRDEVLGKTQSTSDKVSGFFQRMRGGASSLYEKLREKADQLKPAISSAAGSFKEGVSQTAAQAQSLAQQAKQKASSTLSKAAQAASAGSEKIREKMAGESSSLQEADLYVANEKMPRILATKLAQGQYFLKETGKPISSITQIKGAIIDEHGSVVVAPQELGELMYYSQRSSSWVRLYPKSQGLGGIVTNLAKSLATSALSLGQSALDVASSFFKKDTPSDVYVEGEKEPRLFAIKMAKGHYTDAESGDVVKTPKDIKGPIKDENGQTVVTREDLDKLNVYNWSIRKWSPLWIGKQVLKGMWWFETKVALPWTKFNLRMLGKAAKFIAGPVLRTVARALGLNIPDPPKDVYVAGEESPRLTAVGFKKGYYRDRESNSTLRSEKDIQGPVIDQYGNTLLDEEDLKNIVVFDRVLGRFSPLRLFKLMAWLAKAPFRAAGWLLKNTVGRAVKASAGTVKGIASTVARSASTAAGAVGRGALSVLGVQRKARSIGPEANAAAEAKANAGKYRLIDRFKNTAGTAVSKFKALFGAKVSTAELATLPVGEAAAVKSSSTLEQILTSIKSYVSSKKKEEGKKDIFAKDEQALEKDKDGRSKLRDLLDKRLKKKEAGGAAGAAAAAASGAGEESLTSKALGWAGAGASALAAKSGLGKLLGRLGIGSVAGEGGLLARAGVMAKGAAGGVGKMLKGGAIAAALGYGTDAIAGKLGAGGHAIFEADDDKNWKRMTFLQKVESGLARGIEKAGKLFFLDNLVNSAQDKRIKSESAALDKQEAEKTGKVGEGDKKSDKDKATPVANAIAASVAPAAQGMQDAKQSITAGVDTKATLRDVKGYSKSEPEAKPPETTSQDTGEANQSGSTPSSLPAADGSPFAGTNGMMYASLKGNVKLDGLNPQMKQNLMGMLEEYGSTTGKKVPITDGVRSSEDQERMFQKYGPGRAARPGTSMHEFGLAVDIDSKAMTEMEQLGLTRKYGFTRPVGREPWHVEPIGIQTNLAKYKKDPTSASDAILAGVGKGGGGLGIDPTAKPLSRSVDNSLAIAQASSDKPDAPKLQSKDIFSTSSGSLDQQSGPQGPSKATLGAGYGGSADTLRKSNITIGGGGYPNAKATDPGSSRGPSPSYTPSGAGNEPESKPQRGNLADQFKDANSTKPVSVFSGGPADLTAKVPDPQGPGVDGLRETVAGAAKLVGVDKNAVMEVIAMESGFNPNARAGSSSAAGLGQFTAGTWSMMMRKYASKYGIDPNTPPTDAKASAIMTALYLRDNAVALGDKTDGTVGPTEAYLGHFLGTGGAAQFLDLMHSQPDRIAAQSMPQAAGANKSIFYDGNRPRTVSEVYSLLDKRMRDKAKAYGIDAPESSALASATSSGTQSKALPTADAEVAASSSDKPSLSSPTAIAAAGGPRMQKVVAPAASLPARPTPIATMASLSGPMMPSASAPQTPASATAAIPASPAKVGGMDSDVFAKAEDILNQQLAVQKEMRDFLKTLADGIPSLKEGIQTVLAGSGKDGTQEKDANSTVADASTQRPPSKGPAYELPRGAVSMKRAIG